MALSRSAKFLVGIFTVSGAIHLVKPEVYLPLIPKQLPAPREIVLGSGVAELACAAGMLHPRTRSAAGWASAALLIGVFPGNIKMALDSNRSDNTGFKAAAWARLPLQFPMIKAALDVARG